MKKLNLTVDVVFDVFITVGAWICTVGERYLEWLDERVDSQLTVVLLFVLPLVAVCAATFLFPSHWVSLVVKIAIAVVACAFFTFVVCAYWSSRGTNRPD